jgi:hypothetical protein
LVGSTCHACIGDCSRCTSRDECTECKNHRYLYDTSCVSECPDWYYEQNGTENNGANGTCPNCPFECQTCETRVCALRVKKATR